MEAIRQWILTLGGTAAFTAAAQAISPEGSAKRGVRFACGLGIIAAMLSLGIDFDWDAYAMSLAAYRELGEQYSEEGENLAMENTRAYIETECEAYIASKGSELGVDITAEVTARWSDEGYWYPDSVLLSGTADAAVRAALTETVETELGICETRQLWEEQNG